MDIQAERFAAVIDAVATPQFYPHLLGYLEHFFAFDDAIVYAFENGQAPHCLMKTEKENSDEVNSLYQQGAYLQDPFYRALHVSRHDEVLTLRQLAPNGFYYSDYYRNFYCKTGWQDEAAVLLPLTSQRRLGVFFGSSRRVVSVRSPQLSGVLALIKSVVRLHSQGGPTPAAGPEAVKCNDAVMARYALTPREREIVDLILHGQGSQQIAACLFISLGTVKNHRKNIYNKLNISSQAALFSLFLHASQQPDT